MTMYISVMGLIQLVFPIRYMTVINFDWLLKWVIMLRIMPFKHIPDLCLGFPPQ